MNAIKAILRIQQGRGTLAEARVAAGLDPGQVTHLTGIPRDRVVEIEGDAWFITAQEWAILGVLYDVPGFAAVKPKGAAGAVVQCRVCGCVYTHASTSAWVPSGERHDEHRHTVLGKGTR